MTVASVMTPAQVTLRESDSVTQAVHELVSWRLLFLHTHSTLPVVEEQAPTRFLGIVSYWNLLDALSKRGS